MDTPDLYNLSPLLQMMLGGLVLAVGPLAWVWLRNKHSTAAGRLQALTVLTLFLTFDLVMFGAFTRLTDSGLGCPDWPGCYGHASPVGAHGDIAAAQAAMPTGPVTHQKAWIEMIHRYLATGVGVLILVLAVVSWLQWRRARQSGTKAISPWWPTLTLVWVCLQGAFGALTVTMKLFPAIVTLHLLGGLVLLLLLCAQAALYARADGRLPVQVLPTGLVWLLWAGVVVLGLQIALGGWVSTNYAVLACTQFPTCQDSWWPAMDFRQGFELWRSLGRQGDGGSISFEALTAIHYVHRLMAYVAALLLALLAWKLNRFDSLRQPARWLALLLVAQLATGLSNVVLGWPMLAAVLHTGGAAAMVVVLTWTVYATGRATEPVGLTHLNGPRFSG
jgi:cytochrome c oxidase assembly protein subunit 15